MNKTYKYKAFISYSHKDKAFAKWLHKRIENYKIPDLLREKYPYLPKNLKRSVFKDEDELPTSSVLSDNLTNALDQAELLIVICSPWSATSKWVNKEIAYFKSQHGESQVLAIIKSGEPNASDSSLYDDSIESFPESLRYTVGEDEELTSNRCEPLAADARKYKEREMALMKMIAGILKVDFADLWEREKREKRKRNMYVFVLLVSFVALAFYASTQFVGDHVNKELEKVKTQISKIEYSIRHDNLPMEKVMTLNKALDKLKKLKKAKEDTQKSLGILKSSLGKKVQKVYEEKGAQSAIELLTSRDALVREEQIKKESSLEKITLAKLYIEVNEFEKAQKSYESAIGIFFDYSNVMEYVRFLYKNHNYDKAIDIIKDLEKTKLTKAEEAGLFNAFGNLYSVTNQFYKSEAFYLDSIMIRRELAEQNPNKYNQILGATLYNLSVLYQVTDQIDKQEIFLNKTLKIYKDCAEKNPNKHKPQLAQVYSSLGGIYNETNRNKKAEDSYTLVSSIYKSLSPKYDMDLVTTYMYLANIYKQNHNNKKSEEVYMNTLNLMENGLILNSTKNSLKKASFLMKIGDVFQKNNMDDKAESSYVQALDIRRSFATEFSDTYLDDVANTLNTLGNFYKNTNQNKKAINVISEAQTLYEDLTVNKNSLYIPRLADTCRYLGDIYAKNNQLKESEKAYLEALSLYRQLDKQFPITYKNKIGHTLSNLGTVYQRQKKYRKAEELFNEGLKIYINLSIGDPRAYSDDVIFMLNLLEWLYLDTNEFKKAEKINNSTLDLYENLSQYKSFIYDRGYAETLIRSVSLLHSPISFLNQAESILQTYIGNPEADKLLKKIKTLKKRSKKK